MKMIRLVCFILIYLLPILCLAQNSIELDDKNISASLVYDGRFEWAWYSDARGGVGSPVGNEFVRITRQAAKIIYVKRRVSTRLAIDEIDSLVLDANNLLPLYKSYRGEDISYSVQYGAVVKGSRTIHETRKKEHLEETVEGKFFDLASLPLVISCLPLKVGLQASIPIIDFTSTFKPIFYQYRIVEVRELETLSERSGKHSVWVVRVVEKKRGHEHLFYINKQNRRIQRIDFMIPSSLLNYAFFDQETDVNPIKAAFNLEETMAMLTQGNSKITGQVYLKGYGKKFKDYRDRKKQFAEKGTTIFLIPNTPYFKEWADYNLKLSKLSGPIYTVQWDGYFGQQSDRDKTIIGTLFPMPEEVTKCILMTAIQDDKGNFSFENLKPGEYLLFVTYSVDKYSHSTSEYKGQYTAVYGVGSIESYPIWDVKDWTTPGNVKAHKYVVVKKNGDVVKVDFKE